MYISAQTLRPYKKEWSRRANIYNKHASWFYPKLCTGILTTSYGAAAVIERPRSRPTPIGPNSAAIRPRHPREPCLRHVLKCEIALITSSPIGQSGRAGVVFQIGAERAVLSGTRGRCVGPGPTGAVTAPGAIAAAAPGPSIGADDSRWWQPADICQSPPHSSGD